MVNMQREEWLSLLLQEQPDRLMVLNPEGQIIECFADKNQTACCSYKPQYQHLADLKPTSLAQLLLKHFHNALQSGKPSRFRYSLTPTQLLDASIDQLQAWGDHEQRWFEATFKALTLSNGTRYVLWQEREITQAYLHEAELKKQAETDELTGVLNRRAFLQGLEREFDKPKQPLLACLMVDIDHFKEINDQVGHLSGDEVITQVAHICQGSVRSCDYIGRLGGEEFGVVLTHTTAIQAYDIAERIRQSIESTPCRVDNHIIYPTVSIGIAELTNLTSSVRELLVQADKAMYYSKQTGRNQVTLYYPTLPEIKSSENLKANIRKAS
ncbi:GGDEF domain-containing protein [Vibrio sp. RE86]|uniref:GGDEF domain-containing protein n=1 Tax=Vibrio sp. RE86 TaxID=2607605 RepID=UPI0014936F8A|nr:GGDEF domain-containing protein [Vibrio sp. RE86]NOH81649.1 GGDEF domain-containing protein [Vibrio sp. RE86]